MRGNVLLLCTAVCLAGISAASAETLEVLRGISGRFGGRLVVAQRAEPKTLNPVTALDAPSREVIRRMTADLVTINRESQKTEPGLAREWSVSSDGRRYTLHLRRGIRFSDGHPMDANDVTFTFQVYLDDKVRSPQRDLLIIGGKPISVHRLDDWTVRVELARPHAAAERLFDSIAILPRHLLEKSFVEGKLNAAWGVGVAPESIAGLGPFRLKQYVAGERIVLERNPHYWKAAADGRRLPFLDELVFLFTATEDAQLMRFLGGETQILQRLNAKNFAAVGQRPNARDLRLLDIGPSLEYNFLFFNLNDVDGGKLPRVAAKQAWFRQAAFRRAVSSAIDRQAIVKLVYDGRATALVSQVTPANRLWVNSALRPIPRDIARSRELLRQAGFSWNSGGRLLDAKGTLVEFTILTSSSNTDRIQMASIIQEDLKQLGIGVLVVPYEFRAMLDRILNSHDYDAAILGLGGGDVDPNSELNVWMSNGGTHLWDIGRPRPDTPWQAEIDSLMRRQIVALRHSERKRLYDRVQEIVAEQLPVICLASPHVLVGARASVGNFRPAVLDHSTLWNADQLFLRDEKGPAR